MTELMQASREWAKRPADERYTSLVDLRDRALAAKARSVAKVVPTKAIHFTAGEDHKSLFVGGPDGQTTALTNWSFGQLCGLGRAPAGYLRDLPSELVADNLNYGIQFRREIDEIGVLVQRGVLSDDAMAQTELRAATGPNYGRIWNADIAMSLVDRFGDGLTGDFRVPGEFGKSVAVSKANTTLYASDRDMFVFLADETNRVDVHNRRSGAPGSLARGFFVWNSEVGSTTFGVAFFLFDYACSNRIVWGAQQYTELRIRHTVSAPDKWIDQVQPVLADYVEASAKPIEDTIKAAQARKIAGDLDDFLKARKFSLSAIRGIKDAHEADEGRPIETLWDAVTGITAHARSIAYQDERVAVERTAGKLLDLVAA